MRLTSSSLEQAPSLTLTEATPLPLISAQRGVCQGTGVCLVSPVDTTMVRIVGYGVGCYGY